MLCQHLAIVGATTASIVEFQHRPIAGEPSAAEGGAQVGETFELADACIMERSRRLVGLDLLARRTVQLRRRWAVAVADDDDVDADDLQVPPTSPPSSEEWLGESVSGQDLTLPCP